MHIEQLLEDLRRRQTDVARRRGEALDAGDGREAESLRLELTDLMTLEDRLLRLLGEICRSIETRPADLNLPSEPESRRRRSRVLAPGTRLKTSYKGRTIQARVNSQGKIIFEGEAYASIAALAQAVTGKEKNHLRNRKFWDIKTPG